MKADVFLIPDLELNDPAQTVAELQDICGPYNIAGYFPQESGKYTVSVSRPVPIDMGAKLAKNLGVSFSEAYWPPAPNDLKLEITDHPFERVSSCMNDAVLGTKSSVQKFSPTIRKVTNDGEESTFIIVPAGQSAYKQDTVLYCLIAAKILDRDSTLKNLLP